MHSTSGTMQDLMTPFKAQMNAFRVKHIQKALKLDSVKPRTHPRTDTELRHARQAIVLQANVIKQSVCSLEQDLKDIEAVHQAQLAEVQHENRQLRRNNQKMTQKIHDLNEQVNMLQRRIMDLMMQQHSSTQPTCSRKVRAMSLPLDLSPVAHRRSFPKRSLDTIDDDENCDMNEVDEDSDESHKTIDLLPRNHAEQVHLNELDRFKKSQDEDFVIGSQEPESSD